MSDVSWVPFRQYVKQLRMLQRRDAITPVKYKDILADFYSSYFNLTSDRCKLARDAMEEIRSFNFTLGSHTSTYAKILLFPKNVISTKYVLHLFHTLTAIGISNKELLRVLIAITQKYDFEFYMTHKSFRTGNTEDLVISVGFKKIYLRHFKEKT